LHLDPFRNLPYAFGTKTFGLERLADHELFERHDRSLLLFFDERQADQFFLCIKGDREKFLRLNIGERNHFRIRADLFALPIIDAQRKRGLDIVL
jgi:hypothetical protein